MGVPTWAPYTLDGASEEIIWQGGRLDDKNSDSHPEVELHPVVNALELEE